MNPNPNVEIIQWLTIPEIAARLRVSRMTAYRLVHSGDIPAYRVGRGLRIAEDDFTAYLERARNGAPHA